MEDIDVEKICRLCCEKKGRLRSLFEGPQKYARTLPDIICDISRLQVERNDGLPQMICRVCSTALVKMYDTIESYRNNDLRLRQMLSMVPPVEIKEEEVDVDLLENAFVQELQIEHVPMKEEDMNEEYLESDLPSRDTSQITEQLEGEVLFKREDSDDDSEDVPQKDDEEWEPQDIPGKDDKKPLVGKSRKRKKQIDETIKSSGRRHRKAKCPDRPRKNDFKCYICMSDSHGTPEALLAHLNGTHQDLLPFTCPECVMETIVINTLLALNSHKKQHLNPEKCPLCDKRYTHKNNLEMHIQMHHSADNSDNSLTCTHCGEIYPTKSALYHHTKIHTTAASCEICGKIFKERSKLKRHIQNKHEKLRKYECHICQKKLSSMDSVQIHIKTFHSAKTLKCSFCPKTFGSELVHRAHEKRHLDHPDLEPKNDWKEYYTIVDKATKQRKCNLCGMVTTAIGSHLARVHFPTEYRCKVCDQAFKSKQTCEVHELAHEYGKAFHCPICAREFSERKLLICHLRTKQHQDHPLALEMLGTVRTKRGEKNDGDVDVDDAQSQ
ncbi:zinc finger protein 836 [Aedes albopictus]|uniref:C2h2-type zn-finger protein n=1 Tax=Aedes albopictus TaxID=7160 RepID=A0ABM1Y4Q6_AEDAL